MMPNPFQDEYQAVSAELKTAIFEVLSSGWYILGPRVKEFEDSFAAYLNASNVIGVANGLDAILIALMGLGIGKGDEVITTSLSAVATTLAITRTGATPVFVDIDGYYHLDAEQIESKITPQTKAIIPVHLYGQSVDIERIAAICKTHNLHLIEDVAQAHGATCGGKKLGTFGIAGAFSFYPTKNLGAYGDAGALVTSDEKLAKSATMLRNYGQETRYKHELEGINSRLDEIQAAILSIKLPKLDEWNKKRSIFAETYTTELKEINELVLPEVRPNTTHVFHQYVVQTPKRDELLQFLQSKNIPALIHYPIPIHKQPCYPQFNAIPLPATEKASERILSLPIYPFMTNTDQETVIAAVKEFFRK